MHKPAIVTTRIHEAQPPDFPPPVARVSKGPVAFFVKFAEWAKGAKLTGHIDLFTAAQLAERDGVWQAHLDDLKETHTYFLERSAQRSQRLWKWAHEELSEPLKTRYFNIVANGTADWLEQPEYAQQYNALKYRTERAEEERDALKELLSQALPALERLLDVAMVPMTDQDLSTPESVAAWESASDVREAIKSRLDAA